MDLPESRWIHPQGLCNHHVQIGQAFLQAAVLRGWLRQGANGGCVRILRALGLFHELLPQLQQTFLRRSHPDDLSVAASPAHHPFPRPQHILLALFHYQRQGGATRDLGISGCNMERPSVMVYIVYLTEGRRVTWGVSLECRALTG